VRSEVRVLAGKILVDEKNAQGGRVPLGTNRTRVGAGNFFPRANGLWRSPFHLLLPQSTRTAR
jgi:hypothetical protein